MSRYARSEVDQREWDSNYHDDLLYIVIELPASDDAYPPQKKSFMMMKFLFNNHLMRYQWFLRLDDDSYVKISELRKFLSKLDPSRLLYIGSPAFGINEGDFIRTGENYCMGGPGKIFSRELLRQVGPNLSKCLRNLVTEHEDIELGRCIQRTTGVKCTESFDSKEMFRQNYEGSYQVNMANLSAHKRKSGIIFHSNKDSTYQYHFHRFVLEDRISDLITKITIFEREVEKMLGLQSVDDTIVDWGYQQIWYSTTDRNVYAPLLQHPTSSLSSNLEDVMKTNAANAAKHLHGLYPKTPAVIRKISTSSSKYFANPLRSFNMICDLKISISNTKRPKKVTVVRNVNFARHFTRNFTFFMENSPLNFIQTTVTKTQPESGISSENRGDKIHIIVPLSGRKEQFAKFLRNYEIKFLKKKSTASLIIVYVLPVDDKSQSNSRVTDFTDVSSYFQDIQRRYTKAELKFVTIHGNESFSRGVALQEGVRHVSKGGMMLFCDVDVLIDLDILYRIRRNTVNTSMVYFPIFFACHDPNVIRRGVVAERFIGDTIGFWREFSFGMVAIYKHDFLLTEGFKMNINGWGLEDLELADTVIKSKRLQIFRAKDPAMIHLYHEKYCPNHLTMVLWHSCELARAQHFGPKTLLYRMWKSSRLSNNTEGKK